MDIIKLYDCSGNQMTIQKNVLITYFWTEFKATRGTQIFLHDKQIKLLSSSKYEYVILIIGVNDRKEKYAIPLTLFENC